MNWYINLIRRLCACLLDMAVFVGIIFPFIFWSTYQMAQSPEKIGLFMLMNFGVGLVWIYFYFSKDAINGISPGRWLTGIAVRNQSDHKSPKKNILFYRNLYLIQWPLELIELITNKYQLRKADKRFKTVVIKDSKPEHRTARIIISLILVLLYFLFLIFIK